MKTQFEDLKTKLNLNQTHALIGVCVLAGIAFIGWVVYYQKYKKAVKREKEVLETENQILKIHEKTLAKFGKAEDTLSDAIVAVKKAQDMLRNLNEKEGKKEAEHSKSQEGKKVAEPQTEKVAEPENEFSEADKEKARNDLSASLNRKPQEKIGEVVSHALANENITNLALSVIAKVTDSETETPDNEAVADSQEE